MVKDILKDVNKKLIIIVLKMRPRYYVHMGPRAAEKVSIMWKAAHITIFFLLLCSSSIAMTCIYYILDMYRFNCIIYAKISFEQTYEERLKVVNNETAVNSTESSAQKHTSDNHLSESTESEEQVKRFKDLFFEERGSGAKLKCVNGCENNDNMTINQDMIQKLEESPNTNSSESKKPSYWINLASLKNMLKNLTISIRKGWKIHPGHHMHENIMNYAKDAVGLVKNSGYLNMRKTVFATIYMCNLMLFAPLVSIIASIFLGALIAVGGRGGAGNPGDLLPNPWICVYPFLACCSFMMILSFVSDNLFHRGLATFCMQYYPFTKVKWCTEDIDQYNVQFSSGRPRPFYMTYLIGSIGVQLTSALWVIQTLMYLFRILCLADFSLYMTKISVKGQKSSQQAEFASVVLKMLDKDD